MIIATNQGCAESARRAAFKYPNRTWVLTCNNIFAFDSFLESAIFRKLVVIPFCKFKVKVWVYQKLIDNALN